MLPRETTRHGAHHCNLRLLHNHALRFGKRQHAVTCSSLTLQSQLFNIQEYRRAYNMADSLTQAYLDLPLVERNAA